MVAVDEPSSPGPLELAPTDPTPPWAPLAVTLALLLLVAYLVVAERFEGLAGAITGSVYGYWLPVRPNRRPQPPPADRQ